jgi:TonB-linked SusC/RagA family outer membrane protein
MRESKRLKFFYLPAFLMLFPYLVWSQQTATIKGNVKDESGETLIGVNVLLEGNNTVGTITDVDGNYSITASPQGTLVFSYIGYRPARVAINGKTRIDVVLEIDSKDLEEVVVIAYGTQKKITITGAVNDITGEELIKAPTASMGNALSGKLPGLATIQYSGLPGGDDPTILIRGVNSLSVDNSSPLVLVDGVPRSFTQIDPNEVASISILKDASATAVYGVRGANGVILITTKRGEQGRTQISVTSSFGIQKPTDFLDFTDSYQYAMAFNTSQRNDGVAESDLKFQPDELNHYKTKDSPLLYPGMNWVDYVMKDYAPQSQHNINISGGDDKARFFISAGMLDQDGLFNTFSSDKNSNFHYSRYNYRANLDLNMGKLHTLSLSLGGRTEDRRVIGSSERNLFQYLMDTTPMSGAGVVDGKHIVANRSYVSVVDRDGLNTFYGLGYVKSTTNVLNFDLTYALKLDFITPGLNFKAKGAYNSSYTVEKSRTSGGLPSYTPVLSDPSDPNSEVVLQKSGDAWNLGYEEGTTNNPSNPNFARDWYAEASFDYARSFGHHSVTALLLYNQTKRYYPYSYTDIPTGYIGLVGRVTYNYQSRYLLDLNMGYNGSENFAPGKRYGLFPSASLGWIVTSEKFMENQKVITYLKLRYSYGLVGNDGSSRFLYIPGSFTIVGGASGYDSNWTSQGRGYNFGVNNGVFLNGAYETSNGYPDVTWEKSTKQNLGMDLKTLDNRLGVSIDVFNEARKDILISNASILPGATALKAQQINFGRVESHGYEVQLNWSDKVGNDFRYTIAPNLSFSRNKVIEQMEVRQNYPWLYSTGHPVSQPFGYVFFGFYDGQKTEDAYKQQYGVSAFPQQMTGNLKPGDAVYVDLSGDGRISSDDRHAIGYPNYPEYTLGATMNFSYKGFDLSMTWQGVTHVSRMLSGVYRPAFGPQQRSALLTWFTDNAWTEDTKDTAILPRFSFNSQANNTLDSEVWLIDASYLRLKNLELGYNFPQIRSLGFIKGLRLYANGTNLLTFRKFKGNDPENSSDFARYPQMKVYTIALRANF